MKKALQTLVDNSLAHHKDNRFCANVYLRTSLLRGPFQLDVKMSTGSGSYYPQLLFWEGVFFCRAEGSLPALDAEGPGCRKAGGQLRGVARCGRGAFTLRGGRCADVAGVGSKYSERLLTRMLTIAERPVLHR
jgi:hypothetical protein